ncbi:uncharacterized protein N7498_004062 [Penicillium cinerascens]|uniref:CFEM domain-containing protein n=1 Tax=Penicillium cinerascens TaxID=70096 RepID=A0A9W9N3D6_9EURO|nr:uncharacterized protein N7498_004062 [Penicillium cinerascens]KAJ5212416.1 hypothetical protein N7498_004062 [Penicillium cinerascens]
MKLSTLAPLAALLSFAVADFPDEDISECLIMCLSIGAGVAGCASYVDTRCTCHSIAFKDAVGKCLQKSCIKEDIDTAAKLHQKVCGHYE